MSRRASAWRTSELATVAIGLALAGCACSDPPAAEPAAAAPAAGPAVDRPLVEPSPPLEPVDLCATFAAARDPELSELGLDGGCIAAGDGAWQLESEVTEASCEDESFRIGRWQGRMRIRYRARSGATAALPWVTLPGCEARTSVEALGHHDWDGDGHHELAVRVSQHGAEDGSMTNAVWRFDGEAVLAFAPAADCAAGLLRAEDVDGDAHLDLVSLLPLGQLVTSWSADGGAVLEGDVLTLWHALPDGTFSRGDEVARAFLREQCPLDTAYFSPNDLDAIRAGTGGIHASIPVVCARLRGLEASELRAALVAELAPVPCDEPAPCYRDDVVEELIELAERTNLDVRLE
jgi:hypothetical protein